MSRNLFVEDGHVPNRVAVLKGINKGEVSVTHQPKDSVDTLQLKGLNK